MSLIGLIVLLVLAGVLLYFIRSAPFIEANVKWIICAVVIVALILIVLNAFGLLGGAGLGTLNRPLR